MTAFVRDSVRDIVTAQYSLLSDRLSTLLLRMGELEAFYARRRRVTFVICLASTLQAILFGSSVLIEGLLTTFDEPPEPGRRTYAFHGLYAKVLITPVANIVAAQMMWTFKRRPELKVPVLGLGVFLQGVGFAVAGAGADACATYGRRFPHYHHGTRLDFLWRRGRGRPDRRLLCFSELRLPR